MKVVCILRSTATRGLTEGKIYIINLKIYSENYITVIDDSGKENTFPRSFFSTLEEWRDIQLKKLEI